jgi:hypothetical protein
LQVAAVRLVLEVVALVAVAVVALVDSSRELLQ